MPKLEWHPESFVAKTVKEEDKFVRRIALMVAKEAVKSMSTPKHGVQPPRPANRRSRAGEAPARQTHHLIGSIKTEKVGQAKYRVGSPVDYGFFLEFGTRPYTIKPKRGKYLRFQVANGSWVTTEQVNHPGIAARPWLRPAMLKVKALVRNQKLTWKGPTSPR